jgi:hypothetical protein
MPKKADTKRSPRRSSGRTDRSNKAQQGRQKASEAKTPRRTEHPMDMEE